MPDELILFEKMQRGDTSALEYFFREYTDVLYYRALGFVKDNLAAEDIVQEVFIRFWQLRKNLKITDSVPGYLCKAVDHRCHNYLEHLKVKHRYEESQKWEEVMEEVSEDEEELNIMRERLKMFVDSLPEKCREIFILACIEGLKYKQVAEKLDVSVNTVKTQLKSAYSKLRAEFNENDLEIIVLLIFLDICKKTLLFSPFFPCYLSLVCLKDNKNVKTGFANGERRTT